MKLLCSFLLLAVLANTTKAMITWEEMMRIYHRDEELLDKLVNKEIAPIYWSFRDLPVTMDILEEYPEEVSQLDHLILEHIEEGRSLDWVIDSLVVDEEPASQLSDSISRTMKYYLYRDYLATLVSTADTKVNLDPYLDESRMCTAWRYRFGPRNYIHGGCAKKDTGWIRYADLEFLPAPPEVSFRGFVVIGWEPFDRDAIDSLKAICMFQQAVGKGFFVSRTVDSLIAVDSCRAAGYPAYRIDVSFEVTGEFWWPDSLYRVFVFDNGPHQFVIGYSSRCLSWAEDAESFERNLFYFRDFSPLEDTQ